MGWIGSAIETTGNLAIAGINYASQEHTNKVNKQIADDTNAANLKLAREQNDWNERMWNAQNEYNSPENQIRLYQQAGLNPLSYAGGDSTAGSVSSANLANQQMCTMNAPQIDPNVLATISNIKLARAEARDKNADAESKEIDNDNKKSENSYISSHGIEIPDYDVDGQYAGKSVIHFRNVGEYEAFMKNGNANLKRFEQVLGESNAQTQVIENNFKQLICDRQKSNGDVVDALEKLPLADYKKVLQDITNMKVTRKILDQQAKNEKTKGQLMLTEKDLAEFELKSRKSTSIAGMLEAFKDPNMSVGDKLLTVLGVALTVMSSSVSASFSHKF